MFPIDPQIAITRQPPPPPSRSKERAPARPTPEVRPDAADFAREQLGFDPDETQAALLSGRHHRLMLNCSRQWGKSTITAAKAVHVAMSQPGSLVLVAAPCGRQSAEFVRKAEDFASKLGLKIRGDGDNSISILFPNRSRLVGIPGSREANIRGFSSLSLLIIDEAARVPDELYQAARPMLAVGGGDLWLLSTPWRTHGFFYQEWKYGEGWEKIAVPGTRCPRIPAQFLEEERSKLGEPVFRREYLCEFHDLGGALFARELVERCFTAQVALLFPPGPAHSPSAPHRPPLATSHPRPAPGHSPLATNFFLGLDLGQKHDYTAISVLERRDAPPPHFLTPWNTAPTCFELRHLERVSLGTPYPRVVQRVQELTRAVRQHGRCTVVLDGTGVGAPVRDMLRQANLECEIVSVTITGGQHANRNAHGHSVPKRDLIAALMLAIEEEHLRIAAALPERLALVNELVNFGLTGACHDDLVLSLALAIWRAKTPPIGPQSTGRLI